MNIPQPEQVIVFRLAGELFALDVTNIQEILPTTPCRSLPDTADHVQGLMTFRGQVISLMNLGALLNLSPATIEGNTIILGLDTRCIGLMVDSVDEVVSGDIKFEELPHEGFTVDRRYVQGLFTHKEKIVVVLKSSEILSNLEV